jgi:hypothetical protein
VREIIFYVYVRFPIKIQIGLLLLWILLFFFFFFFFFYQFIVKIMIIKTLKIIKWYASFILDVVLLEPTFMIFR